MQLTALSPWRRIACRRSVFAVIMCLVAVAFVFLPTHGALASPFFPVADLPAMVVVYDEQYGPMNVTMGNCGAALVAKSFYLNCSDSLR